MRIAYFASGGPMALLPLRHLAEQHEVVAVVRPSPQRALPGRWFASLARHLGWRGTDPVAQFTQARHIPSLTVHSGSDSRVVPQLKALRPDLICISTFPWLLAPMIFALPPYGAINLHTSLLPRHRGPTPLFWVYYHDDRQTGITVHYVNERADTGDMLCQEAFPLPRGFSITQLHSEKARRGAALLLRAVEAIDAGSATRSPQDDTLATPAPRIRRGRRMVHFPAWDVERVWHFLAGLHPQFLEPLLDHEGRAIVYNQVLGYERQAHQCPLGSLEHTSDGWNLYCLDGFVRLAEPIPRR